MAAQNYASGNSSPANATLGQQFGWSMPYDPDIKTGTVPPPTSANLQYRSGLIKANGGNAAITTEKGSQILQEWALKAQSANPQERAQFLDLQSRLVSAGLLPKNKFIPGMPDDPTQQALQSAIVLAARTGETVDEAINASSQTFNNTVKTNLTSPEQIAALVQSVAPKILGTRAPQAAIDAITQHLHDLQTTAITGGQGAATQDDVTAAPSANGAWFEEQLRQLMPQTSQAEQTGQNLAAFTKMINPQGEFSAYHA